MGKGKSKLSNDRPGVMRGKGRPMNSFDKKTEKRSVTVRQYKEKADKIKAVILNFAENRIVILFYDSVC